jgi:hypothetical protein
MKLAKRTEVELRDSLHEAINRMSLIEIVVLIFLVQMIRTREFVSHILPKPRKMLPEPERDLESDLSSAIAEISKLVDEANSRTNPEPEEEISFSYAKYSEAVMDAIRNNKPYPPMPSFPQVATEAEWARMYQEAPTLFAPPIPMPPRPKMDEFGYVPERVYGGISIQGSEPIWAMCTPSRDSITGYNSDRCNCLDCLAIRAPVTGARLDECVEFTQEDYDTILARIGPDAT